MVFEPPLDAPAEEHAAVSAPMAASAAAAGSGRDRGSKGIVQSSPAGLVDAFYTISLEMPNNLPVEPHFARGTAQIAPDNRPNVRFGVPDVEQSGRGWYVGYPAVPEEDWGSSSAW